MTTIVKFPESRIVREVPPNIEEIAKAKEKGLQKHAETIVEDLILNILDAMENYGIDVETDDFQRDFSFAADAMRASIYRSFNLEHALHTFVDNNVQIIRAENMDDLKEKIKKIVEENKEGLDEQE